MNNPLEEDKLNRLIKEAFPAVEVSPDFTLKLWRGLMKSPSRPPWLLPAPLFAAAAAVGILVGPGNWSQLAPSGFPESRRLVQVARLDLFGNAPVDSLAGSYLNLRKDF